MRPVFVYIGVDIIAKTLFPVYNKKEREELLIAKQTVENILNIEKKKKQEQEKKTVR